MLHVRTAHLKATCSALTLFFLPVAGLDAAPFRCHLKRLHINYCGILVHCFGSSQVFCLLPVIVQLCTNVRKGCALTEHACDNSFTKEFSEAFHFQVGSYSSMTTCPRTIGLDWCRHFTFCETVKWISWTYGKKFLELHHDANLSYPIEEHLCAEPMKLTGWSHRLNTTLVMII